MIPERNGVVLRFPNYGNKYARADVYRLQGFGYVFIANVFYSPAVIDPDADVHHDWGDILEKTLSNEHQIIIAEERCVYVHKDWTKPWRQS
jgi:hypothetical protein